MCSFSGNRIIEIQGNTRKYPEVESDKQQWTKTGENIKSSCGDNIKTFWRRNKM